MGFSWNALSTKQKAMFAASITAIILALGLIIYEIIMWWIITRQIAEYRVPIWDSNQRVDFGFVRIIKKEPDEDLYPLYFPMETTDPHDEIPEAYPAVYCRQCKKPFAFITEIYSPGMKPDKCPLCGNSDPEALIVLENDRQILEFDLRNFFDLYWDDSRLKFLPWLEGNGKYKYGKDGKSLHLWDYWLELQKKKADAND